MLTENKQALTYPLAKGISHHESIPQIQPATSC